MFLKFKFIGMTQNALMFIDVRTEAAGCTVAVFGPIRLHINGPGRANMGCQLPNATDQILLIQSFRFGIRA